MDSPSVPTNTVAKGTVTAVSGKGVAVTFFGRVYGFCTAAALALERGVDDPEENFSVGQLVDVRVVESGKVPLSLSFDTESRELPKPKEGKLSGKVKPGDVIDEVKVLKATDDGLMVVVAGKGAEGGMEEAHVPWPHTPDGGQGKKARKKKYKAGSSIGPAICMR